MSKIWEFFNKYLFLHKKQAELMPETMQSIGEDEDIFTNRLIGHFGKAKLFSLDEEVKNLLIKTKGTNEIERLPFDDIFIDVSFDIKDLKEKLFGEDSHSIKGLLVSKVDEMVVKDRDKIREDGLEDKWVSMGGLNGFRVWALVLDYGDGYTFNTVNVIDKDNIFSENYDIQSNTPKIRKFVLNFVSNFLNLVNNPIDVTIQEQEYSVARNKKRVRQGLPAVPNKNVIIPIGNLKEHIKQLNYGGDGFSYSHRFWVRGHWKEFTDERYKKAKGKRKWVYPYVKGKHGLLIDKRYEVKLK